MKPDRFSALIGKTNNDLADNSQAEHKVAALSEAVGEKIKKSIKQNKNQTKGL